MKAYYNSREWADVPYIVPRSLGALEINGWKPSENQFDPDGPSGMEDLTISRTMVRIERFARKGYESPRLMCDTPEQATAVLAWIESIKEQATVWCSPLLKKVYQEERLGP